MAQEQVLLETIAATPGTDQLLLERRRVKANRPLQQGVQVLKRNRLRMPDMDGAKRVEGCLPLTGVADPLEISVKINPRRHCHSRKIFKTTLRHGRLTA